MACNIALDAVRTVVREQGDRKEIDIKNYAKVEKVLCCYKTYKIIVDYNVNKIYTSTQCISFLGLYMLRVKLVFWLNLFPT